MDLKQQIGEWEILQRPVAVLLEICLSGVSAVAGTRRFQAKTLQEAELAAGNNQSWQALPERLVRDRCIASVPANIGGMRWAHKI